MAVTDKVTLKASYPVPEEIRKNAYVSGREAYDKLYKRSVEDPEGFWGDVAREHISWFKEWDKVEDYNFDVRRGPISVKYFNGAKLNVSYNCLDRHLQTRGDKIAIQWEGNDPSESLAITYKELHRQVCKFANVLKNLSLIHI